MEKIVRHSESYADGIEGNRDKGGLRNRTVWGAGVLRLRELRAPKNIIEHESRRSQEKLLRLLREEWNRTFSTGVAYKEFKKLMEVAFEDEGFLETLQADEECREYVLAGGEDEGYDDVREYVRDRKAGIADPENPYDEYSLLADALVRGYISRMSDKAYQYVLNINAELHDVRRAEIENKIPELKERFLAKIRLWIKEQKIPITDDQLDARIADLEFDVMDPFSSRYEKAMAGCFLPSTNHVVLASSNAGAYLPHVFDHEMFHAISGRTDERESDEYDEEARLDSVRSGVSFDFLFSEGDQSESFKLIRRFSWLNEAITEGLNVALNSGENYEGVYRKERDLYELIRTSGSIQLPESVFLGAYFEDYDPDAPANVPKWKELGEAIASAYQPGFLVKLDQYIEKHGIQEAIRVLKSDWREIVG
jgi:hypothetical protein